MYMSLRDELLSAYIDGEVESPHREQIERQIESNRDVRVRYYRLLTVKQALVSEELPEFEAAQERVWSSLKRLPQEHPRDALWRRFWMRQWRLPAPLVATAALLFAFLLGFSIWNVVDRSTPATTMPNLVQAESPVDLTINLADNDVERLLEWLSSKDMLGEIKVELPESHQFRIIGDPQLLRAADYGRAER